MKRHRFRYISVFILTAILMQGCVSGNNEQKVRKEEISVPQTLIYCTWEDERGYTEKLADAFMAEHPSISIDVQYIDDDMTEQKAAELLSGKDIDIIGLKNINDVLYLAEQGKLVDITDWIAASGIDMAYYGNMYGSISQNGRYWCLPTRKTSWVLAYNKKIFEQENLAEPGQMTWDEFAETAKLLTKGEGENKQWGCYFVNWIYNFMGAQKKNYLYDDDLTDIRKSLEFYNRIYFEDMSSMVPEEMESEDWIKTFEKGNVAMMPMGEWFVGMIMADEKAGVSEIDWDIAPMPVPEGVKGGTTWGTYQLAAISSQCEKSGRMEAAFEFMEYLCGEDGARIYAANGMIPAYVNREIEGIYRDAVRGRHTDVFFDAYQVQENPAYDGYGILEGILEEETILFLDGKQDIDAVMKNFEDRRQQFFHGEPCSP